MDYQLLFIVLFLILFVSFESIDKRHRHTESEINKAFNIENFDYNDRVAYNNKNPFLHCPAKSLTFIEHEYNTPNLILSKQPGRVRECRKLY